MVILEPTFSINRSRTIRERKRWIDASNVMSQLSHFQSPIYYVLTNEAWFVARESNWRRNASPSPRWKNLHYAPDLLLENCDGVVHYKPYADWLFYLALNEKTRRIPGIYPRLYLLKKNWAIFSLGVIRFTFVIRVRLKSARWISLELHYNDTKKLMQMISLILRD